MQQYNVYLSVYLIILDRFLLEFHKLTSINISADMYNKWELCLENALSVPRIEGGYIMFLFRQFLSVLLLFS